MPPIARVKRSRLAAALAVTVVALPVLVLDNLPATAKADPVEVAAVGSVAVAASSSTTSDASAPTTAPPTTIAVEVVTTEAPTTTQAPTTTEAPTTTAAVKALRSTAPAPAPAPTTTTAPPPPPPPSTYGDPADPATWDRLAQCEAQGNWALDSGNGYYGGLQFSTATWQDVGGTGYPHQASREEQIRRGQILQSRYGWGQWPHCSSQLGYR